MELSFTSKPKSTEPLIHSQHERTSGVRDLVLTIGDRLVEMEWSGASVHCRGQCASPKGGKRQKVLANVGAANAFCDLRGILGVKDVAESVNLDAFSKHFVRLRIPHSLFSSLMRPCHIWETPGIFRPWIMRRKIKRFNAATNFGISLRPQLNGPPSCCH